MPDQPRRAVFTAGTQVLEKLPRCAGVYRFLDAADNLLYVGKSVNIRSRVQSHFAGGGKTTRQQRMIQATHRVDVRATAGEVGALLLENAAIKRELPVYNRRQRTVRRMWSFTLDRHEASFIQPRLQCFSLDRPDVTAVYGSYQSRYHARKALTRISRAEGLCPQVLGLEKGSGPCFQYQVHRCLGACAGEESPEQHNLRLLSALDSHRLSAWPVTQPVLLEESAPEAHALAPEREWHLLHNWIYLGTFNCPTEAARADTDAAVMFDRDTYHILRGVLKRNPVRLLSVDSLEPVAWPQQEHAQ